MLSHGNQERMILLNSWEGVYFDINQKGMDQMMGDIADMGGELFVMDDGWFGGKYPRLTDNCALGDWVVDKKKLPEGIEGLLRDAKKHGIKFGIWLEPEMTNTASELYEKHPDWVVKAPKRNAVKGRGGTQLVLDMGNPKVQQFVFNTIDNLLTKYPDIAYIKWDANMFILNHGSQYLGMNEQSHLYINYHQGFNNVMKRIRAKYPDVIIQACASGGGRANWGYYLILMNFGLVIIQMHYNVSICNGERAISSQRLLWQATYQLYQTTPFSAQLLSNTVLMLP